jgi:hypothetical protein
MVDPRIERLRGLIARIEQVPHSSQRDTLLRAVRDRLAALETGENPPSAWSSKPDAREARYQRLARILDDDFR